MLRLKSLLCLALVIALMSALPAMAERVYIAEKDGKYALETEGGVPLTDFVYDDIWPHYGESYDYRFDANPLFWMVELDGRYGCYDGDGSEVLPAVYDYIDLYYYGEHVMPVRLGDQWGYADDTGKMVIDPLFDEAMSFTDGLAPVKQEGKWGYIDHSGNYVIEPLFDIIGSFSEGLAAMKQNGKWGYIDESGNIVIAPRYEYAEDFSEGLAVIQQVDRFGYIDRSGDIVIEPRFSRAYPFHKNGCAEVAAEKDGEYNGHWGVIDKTGAWVIEPDPGVDLDISIDDDGLISVTGGDDGSKRCFDATGAEVSSVGSSIDLSDYMPFEGGKVAVLDEGDTVRNLFGKDHPLPRLDGATALFPVYAAFCQATYPGGTRYTDPKQCGDETLITCTKTNEAYERLIRREADVIFVARPSDEELEMAQSQGVEFELTPIGQEAFVFIVNRGNPLDNITVDEIIGVYSGSITDWSELGVDGLGPIVAYQRPKNSGSQTAMEALMGDTPLMEAPEGVVEWDMGDVVDTIEYRNLPNAIGYSFRFFCTDMMGSKVKLLAVDGVAPTEPNIRNNTYPITSNIYAIRLKGNDNPNVLALLDWIKSPQGLELVEKAGYTPWAY